MDYITNLQPQLLTIPYSDLENPLHMRLIGGGPAGPPLQFDCLRVRVPVSARACARAGGGQPWRWWGERVCARARLPACVHVCAPACVRVCLRVRATRMYYYLFSAHILYSISFVSL